MKITNFIEIIRNNPFYILGNYTNDRIKDRNSHISKIKAYAKVNKSVKFLLDFPSIISTPERNAESADNSVSRINIPNDYIFYSLFWFINVNDKDKQIFDLLAQQDNVQNNIDTAIEQYNGTDNFSAYINLSVLYSLKGDTTKSAENILKLLCNTNQKYFNEFLSYENELLESGITQEIRQELVENYLMAIEENSDIQTLQSILNNIKNKNINPEYCNSYINKKLLAGDIAEIESFISAQPEIENLETDKIFEIGCGIYKHCIAKIKKLKEIIPDYANNEKLINITKIIIQKFCACSFAIHEQSAEEKYDSYIKAADSIITLLQYAEEFCLDDLSTNEISENKKSIENFIKHKKFASALVELCDQYLGKYKETGTFFKYAFTLYSRIVHEAMDDNLTDPSSMGMADHILYVYLTNVTKAFEEAEYNASLELVSAISELNDLGQYIYNQIVSEHTFLPTKEKLEFFINSLQQIQEASRQIPYDLRKSFIYSRLDYLSVFEKNHTVKNNTAAQVNTGKTPASKSATPAKQQEKTTATVAKAVTASNTGKGSTSSNNAKHDSRTSSIIPFLIKFALACLVIIIAVICYTFKNDSSHSSYYDESKTSSYNTNNTNRNYSDNSQNTQYEAKVKPESRGPVIEFKSAYSVNDFTSAFNKIYNNYRNSKNSNSYGNDYLKANTDYFLNNKFDTYISALSSELRLDYSETSNLKDKISKFVSETSHFLEDNISDHAARKYVYFSTVKSIVSELNYFRPGTKLLTAKDIYCQNNSCDQYDFLTIQKALDSQYMLTRDLCKTSRSCHFDSEHGLKQFELAWIDYSQNLFSLMRNNYQTNKNNTYTVKYIELNQLNRLRNLTHIMGRKYANEFTFNNSSIFSDAKRSIFYFMSIFNKNKLVKINYYDLYKQIINFSIYQIPNQMSKNNNLFGSYYIHNLALNLEYLLFMRKIQANKHNDPQSWVDHLKLFNQSAELALMMMINDGINLINTINFKQLECTGEHFCNKMDYEKFKKMRNEAYSYLLKSCSKPKCDPDNLKNYRQLWNKWYIDFNNELSGKGYSSLDKLTLLTFAEIIEISRYSMAAMSLDHIIQITDY